MSAGDLHERVARAMKRTYSVGSMNTYGTILAKLREQFPTEEALLTKVRALEREAKALGAPSDYDFLADTEAD